MRTAIILATFVLLTSMSQASAAPLTSEKLLAECNGNDTERAVCAGYITGIFDMYTLTMQTCPSLHMTKTEKVETIVDYLKSHPQFRYVWVPSLIEVALH